MYRQPFRPLFILMLVEVVLRAANNSFGQQTVEIAADLVRIGETAVEVADRLNKAREVSEVDVLQARVEANSAKLTSRYPGIRARGR